MYEEKNLKCAGYAKRTIQQLFPRDSLNKSVKKIFKYCSSITALNKGNGQFKTEKLPQRVQFSSLHAIQCYEVNSDRHKAMIVRENESGFPPQFGRLDGSFRDILLNDGKGGFCYLH
jgi:hypothetical protein